jgi:hypothetical protein
MRVLPASPALADTEPALPPRYERSAAWEIISAD